MALWNTCLYFLNVPLDKENNHTYYFESAAKQVAFMQSKAILPPIEDYSYQRKDQIIRCHIPYEQIINCNYVMYRNLPNDRKWYYAFIKDMKYVDNGRTDLYIETDVLQTWMFDYEVGTCFIEREHVEKDAPGLHTYPEQLETGEYVCGDDAQLPEFFFDKTSCCAVMAVTELLGNQNLSTYENYEIPSGLHYMAFTTDKGMKQVIQCYSDRGKADAISFIIVAPKEFFSLWYKYTIDNQEIDGEVSFRLNFEKTYTRGILKMDSLASGYYPTNNKLHTFPYSFLQVSNNSGSIVNYKWEDFFPNADGECEFGIYGTITPGCAFKCFPLNYKGLSKNYDEGINMGKLPIGAWNSDVYTNWLTQNSVNVNVNGLASVISIGAGIALLASGGGSAMGAGLIGSGLLGVGKAVGEVYQHSLIPEQANGNTNIGDLNYQFGLSRLTWKRMSIKYEYAKIIDDYFTMYGYKVNEVKVPNKNHRKAFWFTKTIDANIQGAIPKDDLTKIIDCYNKGITFWREDAKFRNYEEINDIITS